MTTLPQCLTLAQVTKLERLPEDTRVVGWSATPPGPVVRRADGLLKVIKPDGRLAVARP
jgi:hypothetical protein